MIRVRVTEPLLGKWEKVLTEHNISQQDAVTALMEFATGEQPVTRAMLFKQVPIEDRADLSRLVLRRLAIQ